MYSYADNTFFTEVETFSVVHGLYTKHLFTQSYKDEVNNQRNDYNESNNFIGLKLSTGDGRSVSFSRFNNSYDEESYALGFHKDLYEVFNYVSFGAEILLTSGYKDHFSLGSDILPVPSLYTKVDVQQFVVKMSLISGSVLGITGEYKFDL